MPSKEEFSMATQLWPVSLKVTSLRRVSTLDHDSDPTSRHENSVPYLSISESMSLVRGADLVISAHKTLGLRMG